MNNPPGYAGPAPKPLVLFIDPKCGHCREAEEIAKSPKYRDYVEIVNVTESHDTYKRMSDANVYQTPTMKTPAGLVAGGPQIADYLHRTYG